MQQSVTYEEWIKNEGTYQKLFEEIPIGLGILDKKGKILTANATLSTFFHLQHRL